MRGVWEWMKRGREGGERRNGWDAVESGGVRGVRRVWERV